MRTTPNAHGATIVSVEPLKHPAGLTWRRVTWEYNGKRYAANAVPGSTANRMAEDHPLDQPARIILNGRNQIVHIDTFEPFDSEQN